MRMSDGAHRWPEPPWWQWRCWDVDLASPNMCLGALQTRLERSTAMWATARQCGPRGRSQRPRRPHGSRWLPCTRPLPRPPSISGLSRHAKTSREMACGCDRRPAWPGAPPKRSRKLSGRSPATHPSSVEVRARYARAHGTSPALRAPGRLNRGLDLKPQFKRPTCATQAWALSSGRPDTSEDASGTGRACDSHAPGRASHARQAQKQAWPGAGA